MVSVGRRPQKEARNVKEKREKKKKRQRRQKRSCPKGKEFLSPIEMSETHGDYGRIELPGRISNVHEIPGKVGSSAYVGSFEVDQAFATTIQIGTGFLKNHT